MTESHASSSECTDSPTRRTRFHHTPGIITITDANTTIGYCRNGETGEIEYLFVHPTHRRRGYGAALLSIVEQQLGVKLRFQSPISPLGRRLVAAYERARPDCVTTDPH